MLKWDLLSTWDFKTGINTKLFYLLIIHVFWLDDPFPFIYFHSKCPLLSVHLTQSKFCTENNLLKSQYCITRKCTLFLYQLKHSWANFNKRIFSPYGSITTLRGPIRMPKKLFMFAIEMTNTEYVLSVLHPFAAWSPCCSKLLNFHTRSVHYSIELC